jgi:hypothetical protein
MINQSKCKDNDSVSVQQLMDQWGTPLRWRCSDARLVLEAGPRSRDRIVFNLEMYPSGWLSIDDNKIETAVAQIYCGDSWHSEAPANEKVAGKLTLIERQVFAEIVFPLERFHALQSMIASGAKPVELVIHVRDLKSDGYGTGAWDKSAAEHGALISDFSLTCRVPDPPKVAESDSRISRILDAIQQVEHRTAEWTKVIPWVLGALLLIAVTTFFKTS